MSTRTKPLTAAPIASPEPLYPPARRSWYVVGVLLVVSIFSFIDRQILSLLVQPIRRDLGITDTQVSLLLGIGFALFFTLFAIPLGRLADRWSRRSMVAAGLAGWSLCTAASALARSFRQMLLLRMGVGIGEASLNPCAYSIITDSFPADRRATAIGVYSMGRYIGTGIAFLAGGLVIRFAGGQQAWVLPGLGAIRPWQLILFEIGLAGLLFTVLLYTFREPVRRGRMSDRPIVPLSEVAAYVSRNRRTLLCHTLGFALFTLAVAAGGAWIPEMFRRNFHWSMPRFALWFGLEVALFGSLGAAAAGRIADGLLRRGVLDANLRVGTWFVGLCLPASALAFVAPSGEWALFWLAPVALLTAAPFGVAAAALQQILPGEMRSQITAGYMVVLNLLGYSAGPTLTALLTQHLFHRDEAVNYALLIVYVFALVPAVVLLRLGWRPFMETLDRCTRRRADADTSG